MYVRLCIDAGSIIYAMCQQCRKCMRMSGGQKGSQVGSYTRSTITIVSHVPQLHTFHNHNCLESSTDVFFTSVCSVLVVKILLWGVNAIVISVTASMKRKLSEGNPAICSRWRRRTQDSGKCLTDAKVEMLPSRIGFSQNALELLHQQLVNAFSTWWSTMLPALLAALLAVEC
jgi:phosphoglycerate-specific signal transduction histidine kinase